MKPNFDDRFEIRLSKQQLKIVSKIVKTCNYEYDNNISLFIRAWIIRGINYHKKVGDVNSKKCRFKNIIFEK